jgi:CubicO group peptidase (beta-lactamase class C family)
MKEALTLRSGVPEDVGMSTPRLRRAAHLAESVVARGVHTALAVLVARKGVVVLAEAYGRLTPDPDSPPLSLDAIFPINSLTKPITATAVMILVEDGLLGLNRPVQEYIPEFVGAGKEAVMVHHLLTHTSGLRDEDALAHAAANPGRIDPPPPPPGVHPLIQKQLALCYAAPLWKEPGAEMSYSGFGYNLLGEIVRRVSGASLADFAAQRIFGPLGMKDTHYGLPTSLDERAALRPPSAPFANDGTNALGWPTPGLNGRLRRETQAAAYGVYSTAPDMAIYAQMFLNRGAYGSARILSPAAVREMTRNQIPGVSGGYGSQRWAEASWGLGWDIFADKRCPYEYGSLQSPRTFGHEGSGGVHLMVDPTYDLFWMYFGTVLELINGEFKKWEVDRFTNAVLAAVTDP